MEKDDNVPVMIGILACFAFFVVLGIAGIVFAFI